MNLRKNENFFVLGLFLAALGLIAGGLLAYVNSVAAGPIKAAEIRNTNQALLLVLPAFDNQPSENKLEIEYKGKTILFMGALKEGKLAGVAAQHAVPGYAGPVQGLIGLEPDGKIRAVLITQQNETPGLGANVCTRQFKKTIFNLFEAKPEGMAPNPTLDQFHGKTAGKDGEWKVKKDGGEFDYVTGSTVTCRAITAMADDIAQCYLANREEITAKLAGGK